VCVQQTVVPELMSDTALPPQPLTQMFARPETAIYQPGPAALATASSPRVAEWSPSEARQPRAARDLTPVPRWSGGDANHKSGDSSPERFSGDNGHSNTPLFRPTAVPWSHVQSPVKSLPHPTRVSYRSPQSPSSSLDAAAPGQASSQRQPPALMPTREYLSGWVCSTTCRTNRSGAASSRLRACDAIPAHPGSGLPSTLLHSYPTRIHSTAVPTSNTTIFRAAGGSAGDYAALCRRTTRAHCAAAGYSSVPWP
jgi:hypothetical protein